MRIYFYTILYQQQQLHLQQQQLQQQQKQFQQQQQQQQLQQQQQQQLQRDELNRAASSSSKETSAGKSFFNRKNKIWKRSSNSKTVWNRKIGRNDLAANLRKDACLNDAIWYYSQLSEIQEFKGSAILPIKIQIEKIPDSVRNCDNRKK
jgi:hypothetical protein